MLKSKHLLASFVLLLVCCGIFAQEEKKHEEYPYPAYQDKEYKDFVKDKYHEQHDKFLDRKYNFPPPPKSQWELGIDLGVLHVSGDVKTRGALPGFGIGGHVRKSLGYVFSIRGNFMAGTTYGEDWQGKQGWSGDANVGGNLAQPGSVIDPNITPAVGEEQSNLTPGGWAPNASLSGNRLHSVDYRQYNDDFNGKVPDYRGLNNNIIFHNYKTRIRELNLSGVVNLNNIKFHKRRNLFAWYGFFGIGGFIYNVKMDQLDAAGAEYDYSRVGSSAVDYEEHEDKPDRRSQLRDLRDGTYESQAEKHYDDYWILGSTGDGDSEFSYKPTAHVGLGTQIKITRRVNIGLESKVTYTNTDLLDGDRWQEWGALTRDYDTYVFTNASLNINLGAKNTVEPLWWMNPLDYSYSELNEAPCCDDLPPIPDLTDSDGDGVPDIFDEEPDSRPDCPVDTRGRMLDSDRDGVLDCDDDQPHTPSHLIGEVDERGVAKEEDCCDDVKKLEDRVRALEAANYKAPCEDSMLPNILFSDGSSKVRKEFGPQLQAVADYLRSNPDAKLCVVGHTSRSGNSAANDLISWKRANSVIEKLVNDYGVRRDQLILQYRGDREPVVGGASYGGPKKGLDAPNALNRRVDFRCCMDGQYDMPRP